MITIPWSAPNLTSAPGPAFEPAHPMKLNTSSPRSSPPWTMERVAEGRLRRRSVVWGFTARIFRGIQGSRRSGKLYPNPFQASALEIAPAYPVMDEVNPADSPAANPERILPWICLAAAVFAMAVFSVVREIQHNRELYRMSQRVANAETQRRQSQQALRMAEAREAKLQAELQLRPILTRNPTGPANVAVQPD